MVLNTRRVSVVIIAMLAFIFAGSALAKSHHNSGKDLLGNKIHTNGQHRATWSARGDLRERGRY